MLARLILRRVLFGLACLLGASALIFAGTEILPGDVAAAILGQSATPEALANLRAELGLEKPALSRYFRGSRASPKAISESRSPGDGRSERCLAGGSATLFFSLGYGNHRRAARDFVGVGRGAFSRSLAG